MKPDDDAPLPNPEAPTPSTPRARSTQEVLLAALAKIAKRLATIRFLELLAVLIAVAAFLWDLTERPAERRARYWQLLSTPATGNAGKVEALEYLASPPLLGVLGGPAEPLRGIDLSPPRKGAPGTFLPGLVLHDVDLTEARFDSVEFQGSSISKANFSLTSFNGARIFDSVFSEIYSERTSFAEAHIGNSRFDCPKSCYFDLSNAGVFGADFAGNVDLIVRNTVLSDVSFAGRSGIFGDSTVLSHTFAGGGLITIKVDHLYGVIFSSENDLPAADYWDAPDSGYLLIISCQNVDATFPRTYESNSRFQTGIYYMHNMFVDPKELAEDRPMADIVKDVLTKYIAPAGCRRFAHFDESGFTRE